MELTPLEQQIFVHEGYRQRPYKDSVGKLTIGIGRNLEDRGIDLDEAIYLMRRDLHDARVLCEQHFPWFGRLSEERKEVLVNMCFNMGIERLKGFRRALAAVEAGQFATAEKEMLDSKWAKQVNNRASELGMQMRENRRLNYQRRLPKEIRDGNPGNRPDVPPGRPEPR